MSTFQYNIQIGNQGVTPIVSLDSAPNSPCELIIQNMNGNGVAAYIGNRFMWDQETYGLKLADGMSMSIALGVDDEIYAFADDWTNLTVLKTSGPRR